MKHHPNPSTIRGFKVNLDEFEENTKTAEKDAKICRQILTKAQGSSATSTKRLTWRRGGKIHVWFCGRNGTHICQVLSWCFIEEVCSPHSKHKEGEPQSPPSTPRRPGSWHVLTWGTWTSKTYVHRKTCWGQIVHFLCVWRRRQLLPCDVQV